MAEKVTDGSWDGSASRFTNEQWRHSCVLDRGSSYKTPKERYGLPVREPDGTLNRNGVHAAAGRLASVQAAPDAKKAAARKLVSLYRGPLNETPPDSLLKAAGQRSAPIVDGMSERRAVVLDGIEFRDDTTSDGEIEFQGHAAVFDTLSVNLGGFREKLQRGAFRKVLASGPDVRFLGLNHNPDLVMARTVNGTLSLAEDPTGLAVNARLAPTQAAQDLRTVVKRGDVTQMSYGFRVAAGGCVWDEGTDEDGNDILVRTILPDGFSALYDVSPVTFPAYQQTDASVRSQVMFGVELVAAGEVNAQELRRVAWQIHRGELEASLEQRQALERVFEMTSEPMVAPWTAERALRACALEPELLAAVPGHRATVTLCEDAPAGEPDSPEWAFRLAARKRRLRLAQRQ
jgi:uncharacterized protein